MHEDNNPSSQGPSEAVSHEKQAGRGKILPFATPEKSKPGRSRPAPAPSAPRPPDVA